MGTKRIIISVLAAVLASFLCSCGIVSVVDLTNSETGQGACGPEDTRQGYVFSDYETKGTELFAPETDLPGIDLRGDVFTVKTAVPSVMDPEDLSSLMSKARFLSYKATEDLTNSKIVWSYEDPDAMHGNLLEMAKSGIPYADLLAVRADTVLRMKADGLLSDMRDADPGVVGYDSLYRQSAGAVTGNSAVYGISGQALIGPGDIPAVFLNENLISKGSSEIYGMVADRKWTWDELISLMDETERGTYVTPYAREYIYSLAFISSGNSYMSVTDRDVPEIGFSRESLTDTVAVIRKLYKTKNYGSSTSSFYSGKVAVMLDSLSCLENDGMKGMAWIAVPLPLGSEGGDYRTLMPRDVPVFAVPSFGCDPAVSVDMMISLCATARENIYSRYLDYVLAEHARENAAVDSIELIMSSPAFDYAEVNGEIIPEVGDATYRLVQGSVWTDSWYKDLNKLAETAGKAMEKGVAPTQLPEETEAGEDRPE